MFLIRNAAGRFGVFDDFSHESEEDQVDKDNENYGSKEKSVEGDRFWFDEAHRVCQISVIGESEATHCVVLGEDEITDKRYGERNS